MRNAYCRAMEALGARPDLLFMTGDLGFMALEPLQKALGPRFINAGVAEQNMVAAAAGAAATGLTVWAYSIAPFVYARPFEQVRNDVCLHGHSIKLVGNGGGYGYGSMGATHHALEDYGVLGTLKGMRAYVPAFAADVEAMVPVMQAQAGPAYLRLGRDEKPAALALPAYAPWRCLLPGGRGVLLAVGPLAGVYAQALLALSEAQRPALWCLSELPLLEEVPAPFLAALEAGGTLCVAEEHVANGGVGAQLALALAKSGKTPARFIHRHAQGYPSGLYGSQSFHRQECGLDAASVLAAFK